jgi:two-component system, NarL family, sensor kinase
MALFRIVQECLSNVHRHSGANSAEIQVHRSPTELVLSISDTGHGILSNTRGRDRARTQAFGVGIPGMKARLKQLGGNLDIRSGPNGTIVTATLPHDRANGA